MSTTDAGPYETPVSERGPVAAYTVNRQPWIPGLHPPYIVATVEQPTEHGGPVWELDSRKLGWG